MSVIKVAAFTGEQPHVVPRLLPPNAAQSAFNTRLDNGGLTPYRKATLATTLAGGPFVSIYRHLGTWLGFTFAANAAPGPIAEDRLYYTGDTLPKMRVDGSTTYQLAVPAPTAAPTATPSGTGSGDVFTRSYVYTFVTAYGEESEPSPASADVNWQSGITITLSGIQNAPGSPARNITKQRFYRTQTGTVGTDFYFIAERSVAATDYVDNVAVDAFSEALPSRNWNPPPSGLSGLIAMPNGMMAAFVGKKLYFCEPYRPHAWPEIYILTTDVEIVALAAMGTTLLVLTKGAPYRATGTTPTAMVMEKLEANLPCVNARGVVDLGHAIAWPSNDGLAVMRGDGSIGLASKNLFEPPDWQRLNPGTMRGGQIEGRWIGSYNGTDENGDPIDGTLIIDLSGETSFLIRSSIEADAWFYELSSNKAFFLLASTGGVYQFDSPTGAPEQYYWRSKEFVLARPQNFGCILVESGSFISEAAIAARDAEIAAVIAANTTLLAAAVGIYGELAGQPLAHVPFAGDILETPPTSIGSNTSVGVYADGVKVATVTELDQVERLPGGFRGRIWEIDVNGDIEVDQITMAATIDELKQAAGGP